MSFAQDRVRFTETDLTVIPDVDGNVDEIGTARENSKFFGIDRQSGRMHIRHRMLPLVHAFKERAAFTRRHILAALPAGPYAHQYMYFDMDSGHGLLLLERPGPEIEEGALLWDSLHAHYAGELMPPTRITENDWPTIDRDWSQYLIKRASHVGEIDVDSSKAEAVR